jgi:hypothetical protein
MRIIANYFLDYRRNNMNTGGFKGKHHTEQTKKKISIALIGRSLSPETIKKMKGRKMHPNTRKALDIALIGHKTSEETRRKIGEANKISQKGKHLSEETKRKISEHSYIKGKHLSIEHRKKIGKANSGEKSNLWRGGLSAKNMIIRRSLEYKLWRESVFERDNFTCIWCGQHGGKLEADHIKPFSLYPELRFAIDNGRTLCIPCHKTTETYGKKINDLLAGLKNL